MDPNESINTCMDPDGDVTLELSGSDAQFSLLVSSKALTLASSVFKAMFNSGFKESLSNRAGSGKHSVALPDDDVEAFTLLCHIFHHHVSEVPREVSVDCLENIATICDKYDCIKVIGSWAFMWLHLWIKSPPSANNLNRLMSTALILDDPDTFSRFSWEIVSSLDGNFVDLPDITDNPLIHCGSSIICKSISLAKISRLTAIAAFKAKRMRIILDLATLIDLSISRSRTSIQSLCRCDDSNLARHLRSLQKSKLWALNEVLRHRKISEFFDYIDLYTDMEPTTCEVLRCGSCEYWKGLRLRETPVEAMSRLIETKKGLCLDCVKTGTESRREGECRIKHISS